MEYFNRRRKLGWLTYADEKRRISSFEIQIEPTNRNSLKHSLMASARNLMEGLLSSSATFFDDNSHKIYTHTQSTQSVSRSTVSSCNPSEIHSASHIFSLIPGRTSTYVASLAASVIGCFNTLYLYTHRKQAWEEKIVRNNGNKM